MAGTLLVYDDAFPRASIAAGPVRNTPSSDELRSNNYPAPYRLLPIWEASSPDTYVDAMIGAAEAMGQVDSFIIFGHGRVTRIDEGSGPVPVTTGIIIGSTDLTSSVAPKLAPMRGRMARGAQAELWVCDAAAAGKGGGLSGQLLCQTLADALGVPVLAATIAQQYTTRNQTPIPDGGWQSTADFLPWEGSTVRVTPRPKR